jgi:hypothetical protein
MSPFSKKFLREGRGMFSRETAPRIHLGAFGKHPGWDDHIDDIGLETESLLLAKQILYVDGIGGQINAGEWEKLGDGQALAEFNHVFAWKRGDALLLGKIWSSRDGKNRTKYPMIECFHCENIPFDRALMNLLPILDRLELQCKEASTADEVRALFLLSQEELKVSLAAVDGDLSGEDQYPIPAQFTELLGVGAGHEGLYRILYYVETQMAPYLTGGKKDDGAQLRPGQIRLPAAVDFPAESLSFWMQFLEAQLEKDVPILLSSPARQSWLDATIGEPATREFYSLRAMTDVVTVASEIPYTITDEFRESHKDVIQAMMEGRPGSLPQVDRPTRPRKWFT